MLVVDIYTDIE